MASALRGGALLGMLLLPDMACQRQAHDQEPGSPGGVVAPSEACQSDDQCTVTDFAGCCDCCGCTVPYAIRSDALAAEQEPCTVIDCDFSRCAEECPSCPRAPLGTAICESGRCVRHPPPGASSPGAQASPPAASPPPASPRAGRLQPADADGDPNNTHPGASP